MADWNGMWSKISGRSSKNAESSQRLLPASGEEILEVALVAVAEPHTEETAPEVNAELLSVSVQTVEFSDGPVDITRLLVCPLDSSGMDGLQIAKQYSDVIVTFSSMPDANQWFLTLTGYAGVEGMEILAPFPVTFALNLEEERAVRLLALLRRSEMVSVEDDGDVVTVWRMAPASFLLDRVPQPRAWWQP